MALSDPDYSLSMLLSTVFLRLCELFASEGLLSVPQKVSSWMAGLVGLRVDNCAG